MHFVTCSTLSHSSGDVPLVMLCFTTALTFQLNAQEVFILGDLPDKVIVTGVFPFPPGPCLHFLTHIGFSVPFFSG